MVCRLHHTADPRKRSEAWVAEAKRGMSTAKFNQEYNIDYSAHQGEKAFPEMTSKRSEIVVKEGPYIEGWPPSLVMWGGFDYGSRNPSSFHVYTVVDGVTYAIWEMYGACKNIIEFSKAMLACPYWGQIRYIVHDPDMDNMKQRDMGTGDVTSVRAQFEKLGIRKWVKGNNDEQGWLSQMSKHWCGQEITFKILDCCPAMIDEFESATYVTMSDKQLEVQNYRESLVDRHNHTLDDCKYFMNSTAQKSSPRKLTIPPLVASYGWNTGTTGVNRNRQSELGLAY